MHIEEIIIEGFKSYANRTVISGWDPSFNAITGLNGSGKSNILDSICFVLGISNLSHVRAANLQDLVYKRGQAGINKATVTIVFNNPDPKTSPIGYEHCRQIAVTRQVIIGGKNKYMINGHIAQQRTIANLFQSVQLNVNNPHFLIMQGKITKVLNMKPPEILAMIEEAAGTRMYEDKKENAEKIIEKKEKKLEEIQKILDEMIVPDLEKKRRERTAFLEYQKCETDVDRLRRIVVAYDYHRTTLQLKSLAENIGNKEIFIKNLLSDVDQLKRDIVNHEITMKNLTFKKEKESGEKLCQLEKAVERAMEQHTRLSTLLALKLKSFDEEREEIKSKENMHAQLTSQLASNSEAFLAFETSISLQNRQIEEQKTTLKRNEQLLQSLQTGLSSRDDIDENKPPSSNSSTNDSSFMGLIHESKQAAVNARTEIKTLTIKLAHYQKELKDKRKILKENEGQNATLALQHQKALDTLASLRASGSVDAPLMSSLAESEKQGIHKKDAMKKTISDLQATYDELSSSLGQLEFKYTEPYKGFNHQQVKGLVAKLIRLKGEDVNNATAVEVTAGGQLYHVVVQDEKVASQLLEQGQLKKRVTIIPLTKIGKTTDNHHQILKQKITKAKQLAPGKVDVALSFVGYNEDVAAAIEYVFGNTLICQDKETAQMLAFHPQVKLRAVTLDGDLYTPTGTLTGGAKASNHSILVRLHETQQAKDVLDKSKEQLFTVERELEQVREQLKKTSSLLQKIKLAEHEANLLKEQLERSTHSQILLNIENINQNITDIEEKMITLSQQEASSLALIEQYQKEMDEFNKDKSSKMKELEILIEQDKCKLAAVAKAFKPKQEKFLSMKAEIEQQQEELKSTIEQVHAHSAALETLKIEQNDIEQQLHETSVALEESKYEYKKESDILVAFDKELSSLDSNIKSAKNQLSLTEASLKTQEHELSSLKKDDDSQKQFLSRLEAENSWISEQKHLFDTSDSPYDFSVQDPHESKQRLKQIEIRLSDLRNNVNSKVMSIIDRLEKEETLLKEKVSIVQNDKGKIEETITRLNEKKTEALSTTFEKVNKDFGAIFGELLPGNFASLVPTEGKTIEEGIEVKVCLGGVWKESLTELSGGQRSLIALALILSLLQFKPAPMYVLDEVDAALDLSHTQNIGHLLKTRFSGSQFIVVSLKEGMFNNANVLFRARFRDGSSIVERFAQK